MDPGRSVLVWHSIVTGLRLAWPYWITSLGLKRDTRWGLITLCLHRPRLEASDLQARPRYRRESLGPVELSGPPSLK